MSIGYDFFAATAFSGGSLSVASPFAFNIQAINIGNMLDRITIPGAVGATGTMSLLWHITGGVSASFQNGFAGAFLGISCNAVNGGPGEDCADSTFNFNAGDTAFDQIVTIVVPIAFGVTTELQITVNLTASAGADGVIGVNSAASSADFSHTGVLTAVVVRDADGNVIPDPTIISESGFDYASVGSTDPGSSISEPMSLSLLGFGFAGLAFMRRKRRTA
jgi:hypothetical protein